MGSYGRLPLPLDPRDFMARTLLEEKPPPAVARTYRYWWEGGDGSAPMILDQGQEGTCEGHGWTSYMIDGPVTHPDFPSFDTAELAHQYARELYYEATGDSTYQQGAYTRQVLDVLLRRGLIGAYHRCLSVDEVVQTLLNIGPVGHASSFFYSMERPQVMFGNAYLKVDLASGVAGGHEYLLTGVNVRPSAGPPFVRMQNSWGPGWGHKGTARISIDDLNILFDGDAFVLTEKEF